jgi:hypothetical protein
MQNDNEAHKIITITAKDFDTKEIPIPCGQELIIIVDKDDPSISI